MIIQEYQGKEILKKFKINIPKGFICYTKEQAYKVIKKIKNSFWIIKAQILSGGRGKAGGIKIAKTIKEVKYYIDKILGMKLITKQTKPLYKKVNSILIEEALLIKKEWYISILVNNIKENLTLIISKKGGMEIENLAIKNPKLIYKFDINPIIGLSNKIIIKIIKIINVPKEIIYIFKDQIKKIYKVFWEINANLLEINPWILTKNNNIIASDIKIIFDSNSLLKHNEFKKYQDNSKENLLENKALKFGMSYISLDGNIGCLVNGAGLAMATMDLISLFKGKPANFLDIGGHSTINNIVEAFKIMLKNKNIKSILINVFGGIMHCDIIAKGVIQSFKNKIINKPIVIRIKGTNDKLAKKMLKDSNLPIILSSNLKKAIEKVIKISKL